MSRRPSHELFGGVVLLLLAGGVLQLLVWQDILHAGSPFSFGWVGIGYKEYFALVLPPVFLFLAGGLVFLLGMLPWRYIESRRA
ncbi:hypothetical protein [Haladaptatus cibarius]|uniref:hypothetical protein n=1 Tax=Haladaptatus cibarius TaxID=453847 RepID=UPI000679ACB5|nr:hypothetical protein [Haladaptatus cibarius]